MSTQTSSPEASCTSDDRAVRALCRQLWDGWNARSSETFAAAFAEDGESIGFDGSELIGRAAIALSLGAIFADHQTGRYVGKIRSVRFVTADVAILRAVAGMAPAGKAALNPQLHAVQILVAAKHDGVWRIASFQNTPAQWHGRPELVEQLTEELQQLL